MLLFYHEPSTWDECDPRDFALSFGVFYHIGWCTILCNYWRRTERKPRAHVLLDFCLKINIVEITYDNYSRILVFREEKSREKKSDLLG